MKRFICKHGLDTELVECAQCKAEQPKPTFNLPDKAAGLGE